MTVEFEGMTVLLLLFLLVTCLAQAAFLGLLLWYVRRFTDILEKGRASLAPPPPEPQGVAVPLPPEPAKTPEPAMAEPAIPPTPMEVDLLRDRKDIRGSIHGLCEKYGLSDLIITTLDGLVVVSRYPGATDEAAIYSDLYRRRKRPDSPDVTFMEVTHRGESMLGILRTDHPLLPARLKEMEEDVRIILNWWL